jgi:hypothetical protein
MQYSKDVVIMCKMINGMFWHAHMMLIGDFSCVVLWLGQHDTDSTCCRTAVGGTFNEVLATG